VRQDNYFDKRIVRPQVVEVQQPLDERERHARRQSVVDPLVLVDPVLRFAMLFEVGAGLGEVEKCAGRDADHKAMA